MQKFTKTSCVYVIVGLICRTCSATSPQIASNANGDLIASVVGPGNLLIQSLDLDGQVVGSAQSIATVSLTI